MKACVFARPVVSSLTILFYLVALVLILSTTARKRFLTVYCPNDSNHINGLDSLRGIAAAAVVLFHLTSWFHDPANGERFHETNHLARTFPTVIHWGEFVALFCVLSGYVIYSSLEKTGLASITTLKRYFVRRFFRIYPLYFSTLIAASFLLYPSLHVAIIQPLLSQLFMLRLFFIQDIFNPPAWSLFPEVHFYLLVPIYFLFSRRYSLMTAAIGFIIFALIGSVAGLPRELMVWRFFMTGILLVEIQKTAWFDNLKGSLGPGLLLLGFLLFYFDFQLNMTPGRTNPQLHPLALALRADSGYALTIAIGSACIILGTIHSPFWQKILSFHFLRFLGTISYSIYLWHPIVLVVNSNRRFDGVGSISVDPASRYQALEGLDTLKLIALYLPAVFLVSAISYLIIERPFFNFGKRVAFGFDLSPNVGPLLKGHQPGNTIQIGLDS